MGLHRDTHTLHRALSRTHGCFPGGTEDPTLCTFPASPWIHPQDRHIPELGVSPVGTTTLAPQKQKPPSPLPTAHPHSSAADGTSHKQGHKHGVRAWMCNGMSDPCLQRGQRNPGAGGAAPALPEALMSPCSTIPLTGAPRMGSCSQTPLPTSLWLRVPLA